LKKPEIDQLYHLLRQASNISEKQGSYDPDEQMSILYGMCRHLLAGGDYLALVQFSQFYGLNFLLDPVFNVIRKQDWHIKRIVEFGAGLGWLGRGLSAKLGMLPLLSVDKRPWTQINLVADMEMEEDRSDVFRAMKDGDLIVACDFLHCLDCPHEVMADFDRWPTAILEYRPTSKAFAESYYQQITRYGALSLESAVLLGQIFPGRKSQMIDLDPHVLLLVEPVNK
jgi:hypothetical protein